MTIERTVPAGVRREIERQESPEFYLVFLTIYHETLIEPIRVVNDARSFTIDDYEGGQLETYEAFRFKIQLLTDNENPPTARLTIQNVDLKIGRAIMKAKTPARLTIEVVAGSQFNLSVWPRQPLYNPTIRTYIAKHLYLTDVEANAIQITGTITSWDYTQELWPGIRGTQDRLPGLFR